MSTGYPEYEIERFRRDTKNHRLEILHDDGLYRHLRCSQPENSWCYWFDIITWPGHLTVVGDFGSAYTFARVKDMLTFFRAGSGWNAGRINPQYWAEKIVSGKEGAQKYSSKIFKQRVDEHVADAIEQEPGLAEVDDDHVGLVQAVKDALTDEYDPEYDEGARAFLRDFEYRYGPHGANAKFEFTDTWEWDFKGWDWSYLWACHAIQWAIEAYDEQRHAHLIWSHASNGWWRPNAAGYTGDMWQAGRYSPAEAKRRAGTWLDEPDSGPRDVAVVAPEGGLGPDPKFSVEEVAALDAVMQQRIREATEEAAKKGRPSCDGVASKLPASVPAIIDVELPEVIPA